MQTSEEVEEVNQDEIEERDVSAQQEHCDDDHERGIGQLLVALDPLLFGLPRPGRFLQLHLHFVEETFAFADHEDVCSGTSCGGSTGQEGLEPPTDGFGDRYSTN